jgi:hypothetical protein
LYAGQNGLIGEMRGPSPLFACPTSLVGEGDLRTLLTLGDGSIMTGSSDYPVVYRLRRTN